MNSFIETLNQWGEHFLSFAWPMLWQSSLLIAALFAVDLLFRRKLRASIRYALWLVVLVKLCVPPTLALPTSPAWWLHKTSPPVAATHYTVIYDNEPIPKIPQNPLPVFTSPKPAMTHAAWLLVASVAISSSLLLWLLVRWWQITGQMRRSATSERLITIADKAQKFSGMKFNVQVKLTTNSMSPAVCGLFRPAILIPKSLVENFSDEQLRAVLLHELIHLRRRDVWVNFLQALLQIFYWWHPLVWLANARIRRVREEAVDDAVMLALRDEAESYAPTLLEVAKLALNRPLASLGLVGILESRHALRQRIERLVDFRPPRKAGLTLVSLLGILAFTAVAVPMGGALVSTNNPTPLTEENGVQTNSMVTALTNSASRTNAFVEKNESGSRVQDAKLYYEMGKLDEAEQLLKSVLALEPENAAAKYYLGLVEAAHQRPVSSDTKSGRQNIVEKLGRVRLDQIGPFRGTPLIEVSRQLSEKTGLNIVVTPLDAQTLFVNLPLALKKVTLGEALDVVAKNASQPVKYSIMDDAIIFSKGNVGSQMFSRTFKVDTNVFVFNLRKRTGLEATNGQQVLKAFSNLLTETVVDLQPPKSVFFNDHGMLFVRATQSDLDTIERAIQALNNVAPQVHIKARFLEVPKETLALLRPFPELTNGVTILPAASSRKLLEQIRSNGGVETLAEPEVTTTSGRQTQMRATQIFSVVTNFTFQETATNAAILPQTGTIETGPVLDGVSTVLSDGYTIDLRTTASLTEFLGYDKSTNTTAAYNSAGEKIDLPKVLPKFRNQQASVHLQLWDGQTVVLGKLEDHSTVGGLPPGGLMIGTKPDVQDKEVLVFITVTIVDLAANRVHSDDEMPFAKDGTPPQ
jgi:beta-lactamase regulating signal transducer with metallopeptidase domain